MPGERSFLRQLEQWGQSGFYRKGQAIKWSQLTRSYLSMFWGDSTLINQCCTTCMPVMPWSLALASQVISSHVLAMYSPQLASAPS